MFGKPRHIGNVGIPLNRVRCYVEGMSNTCTCRQPQFFIPSSAFPYDDKAAYTDFVLKIWTQGRFGIGSDYESFVQMSDRTEIDIAAFHNMVEMRLTPFDGLPSLGRKTLERKVHCAIALACQTPEQIVCATVATNPTNSSALSPNLGRGSP